MARFFDLLIGGIAFLALLANNPPEAFRIIEEAKNG